MEHCLTYPLNIHLRLSRLAATCLQAYFMKGIHQRSLPTGLPGAGADILRPLQVHGSIKFAAGNTRSTSIVLEAPAIAMQLSPASVQALHHLAKSFAAACSQQPASKGPARVQAGAHLEAQEDLRCGLFEGAQAAGSRPGNLPEVLHCIPHPVVLLRLGSTRKRDLSKPEALLVTLARAYLSVCTLRPSVADS